MSPPSLLGKPLAIAATILTLGTLGTAVVSAKPMAHNTNLSSSSLVSQRTSGSHCRVSGESGPNCDFPIYNYIFNAFTDTRAVTHVYGTVYDVDPKSVVTELHVHVFFPDGFVATPVLAADGFNKGVYYYDVDHKVNGPRQWATLVSNANDVSGAWSQSLDSLQVGNPRVSGPTRGY